MENTDNKDALPDDTSDNGTDDFWRPRRPLKTIEEIAAEQGVLLPQDLDAMFGEGKDLWDSDDDFEAWLKDLQKAKQEGWDADAAAENLAQW